MVHDVHPPLDTPAPPDIYGVLGEFDSADKLVEASRLAREAGYRRIDAYSPFPVHGLAEALGARATRLPFIVLIGGIAGGVIGYLLQYYCVVVSYPLNIGGRPPHTWPAFIPITFELTILGAAFAAVLGMLALNGLPRPHHPLFAVPEFSLATHSRFFLCIEARDPRFDLEHSQKFLAHAGAMQVTIVES
jgi:hypothetical protein